MASNTTSPFHQSGTTTIDQSAYEKFSNKANKEAQKAKKAEKIEAAAEKQTRNAVKVLKENQS